MSKLRALLAVLVVLFPLNALAESPMEMESTSPAVDTPQATDKLAPASDESTPAAMMTDTESGTGDSSGATAEISPYANNLHRALLATDVVNREPVDEVSSVPADIGQVFFFTELRSMKGKTVTHRWEYEGKLMGEVAFTIGGNRWRVYSRKNIAPDWTGQWTVTVLDDEGRELTRQAFTVEAARQTGAQ